MRFESRGTGEQESMAGFSKAVICEGDGVQNAKDSFYELLRGRLSALNPERTIVVRGLTRPGALVDENEMESSASLPDCFHLAWLSASADVQGALPTVTLTGEITYSTAGSGSTGGLDRGRLLAVMDGELLAALGSYPQSTAKNDYSALASGGAVSPMKTRVWWGDVVFGAAAVERNRMTRTATVAVLSYQEAGEL